MKRRIELVALGLLPVCISISCQEEEVPERLIRPVKAMKVGDMTQLTGRPFPGRAKATEEVNLSFRVSGPLVALPVKVGQVVKKGEVLAKIDARDYEVTLRSAEAELARSRANLQAMETGARPEEIERLKAAVKRTEAAYKRWQSEYDRIMDLDKKGAATTIEVERTTENRQRAESNLSQAREELRIGQTGARKEDIAAKKAEIQSLQAAVDAAKDQVAYTSLKAPFSGTVAAKYVENFQTVQAKEPIVRLLDTSKIEMTVDVPEHLIPYSRYAKELDIMVAFDAFPDRKIKATIKEIGTEASEATRTYPVTLVMDQPKDEGVEILPGMAGIVYGKGKLPDGGGGIEIPVGAVFTPATEKQSCVWVVDEQSETVKLRPIATGRLTTTGIVVRKGLQPGERIVVAGVHSLGEGRKVKVLDEVLDEVLDGVLDGGGG